MIAIIDYDMGNIHSVQKALESLGEKTVIAATPKEIKAADKVVLPGVGAYDDAVMALEKKNLLPALKEFIAQKKIFLGICLGMQLLFEDSQEAKVKHGLGILKGKSLRFKEKPGLKVPHMGWNQLSKIDAECPLLKGVVKGSYVYFCHSYYPAPANKSVTAATTDYGIDFSSVVWQDNIYGVQFHPEKSQDVGMRILKNFIAL